MLELCTLASGSSGNCMAVRSEDSCFLIDAGISCARICSGLKRMKIDPGSLDGILITHEHSDHISGLQVFLRKHRIPIYTSAATGRQLAYRIAGVEPLLRPVDAGVPFRIGDVKVIPFSTSHDAAGSLGFSFTDGVHRAALATDLGYVTEEVAQCLRGCDFVLLETNYEYDWLMDGPYPYPLKQRILGDRGHLSNAEGAALACMLAASGTQILVLGHLSKENNTPEQALKIVSEKLRENGFDPDRLRLSAAPRTEPGPVWKLQ